MSVPPKEILSTYISIKSPINIALIKYWGKKDDQQVIPLNDSLSMTLNDPNTFTYVGFNEDCEDCFYLNGGVEEITQRMKNVFSFFRERISSELGDRGVTVWSENNFPTASGLASSASGFAALVVGLNELYQLDFEVEILSRVARLGSGSACRSVIDGFARWFSGNDDETSYASEVEYDARWVDEVKVIIIIISDQKKTVSSTIGMKLSVDESSLLKYRVEHIVPKRISEIQEGIKNFDFSSVAEIAMRDSNQFHSICLDTFPPLFYMNDISKVIIEIIHRYNKLCGEIRAGYTFDAGANAVLLTRDETVMNEIVFILQSLFQKNDIILSEQSVDPIKSAFTVEFEDIVSDDLPSVSILCTKIGRGTQIIE